MKQKILVDYKETYADSDWMTSGTDYEYKEVLEFSNKEELLLALKEALVHEEILKEIQAEPIDFEKSLDLYFTHNETSGYYSEDFKLFLNEKNG